MIPCPLAIMANVDSSGRAKRFKVYRNGDERFRGKDFVLNRRKIRTWDAFLQAVTVDVKTNHAVRRICTPTHGSTVESLDELNDKSYYVAVGNGRFKKLGYLNMPASLPNIKPIFSPRSQPLVPAAHVVPVSHSRIQVSGRIRKIPTNVVCIFVHANGQDMEPARRIMLTPSMLKNWDVVLNEVTEKVHLMTGAVRKLYTADGHVVLNASNMKTGDIYVAVGNDIGGFKKLDYGCHLSCPTNPLNRKPRRYIPPPGRRHRRGSQLTSLENSLTSTGSSDKSHHPPAPALHSSPHPPPARNEKPAQPRNIRSKKKEEEAVFHAKPIKYRRSSEKSRDESQKQVDYDKDEGGVFKAKSNHNATRNAHEVEDNADTKSELPVDQREAEEVEDEDIADGTEHRPTVKPPRDVGRDPVMNKHISQRKSKTDARTEEKPKDIVEPVVNGKKDTEEVEDGEEKEDSETAGEDAKTSGKQSPDKNAAATVIQAAYRGYHSRQQTKNTQKGDVVEEPSKGDGEQNEAENGEVAENGAVAENGGVMQDGSSGEQWRRQQEKAATTIQAAYNGYENRRRYAKSDSQLKNTKDPKSKDEEEAALKIQAGYRSYKTRQVIREEKKETDHQAAAASRIQASVRSHQTRKQTRNRGKHNNNDENHETNGAINGIVKA